MERLPSGTSTWALRQTTNDARHIAGLTRRARLSLPAGFALIRTTTGGRTQPKLREAGDGHTDENGQTNDRERARVGLAK